MFDRVYRFSRVLIIGMISFGLLVVLRLIHIQGILGIEYQQQAEQNRVYAEPIPAERGVLLDRYDQPLVRNLRIYTAAADSTLFSSRRPISHHEALSIAATQSALVSHQFVRSYYYPTTFAHTIGYTGAMTKEALAIDKRKLLTDQTGVLGLEKTVDANLLGLPGKRLYEVNALGQKQRQLSSQDAQAGSLVKTTLDPYISQVVEAAMTGLQGSVIVMDAQNGQVLTLFNNPTFNSNDLQPLNTDQDQEQMRLKKLGEYFSDERKLFFNRAVSGMYPPGSIFKLITALSALENQAVQADTIVEDQGTLRVGEYEYANWYYTQYGRVEGAVNLEKALARSNDIYFYKAAEWLGPNQLAETARLYGFGEATGIELPAEAAGLVPDPAWKEKTLGEPWYLGNTFHFGIGQGDVLVTPLQVAQMLQGIVNNQRLCKPSLLDITTPQCHDLGVSTLATDIVLAGMVAACSPGGTGYPIFEYNQAHFKLGSAREQLAAGMVACKTGTAEFGVADGRGYRKTHGWFVAVIPTHTMFDASQAKTSHTTEIANVATKSAKPSQSTDLLEQRAAWLKAIESHGFPKQLIVVVLVESTDDQPYKEGSRDAAPVVKFLLDWMTGVS